MSRSFALAFALATAATAAEAEAEAEDAPGFEIRLVPETVAAEVGSKGAVSLTIAPSPGYRIDRDGPLRIGVSVSPETGLGLPRRRYRRSEAADEQAEAPRFDLRYQADAAGDYQLAVEVRFWLCRRHTCRAIKEQRRVGVVVTAPAAPPDAAPPR